MTRIQEIMNLLLDLQVLQTYAVLEINSNNPQNAKKALVDCKEIAQIEDLLNELRIEIETERSVTSEMIRLYLKHNK